MDNFHSLIGRYSSWSGTTHVDAPQVASSDGHHQRWGLHDPGHSRSRDPDLHGFRSNLPAASYRRRLSSPHETQSHWDAQRSRVQQLSVARFGKLGHFAQQLKKYSALSNYLFMSWQLKPLLTSSFFWTINKAMYTVLRFYGCLRLMIDVLLIWWHVLNDARTNFSYLRITKL